MQFESIEVNSKNGRSYLVRHAREQDAPNVIALERKVLNETTFLPIISDEYKNNLIDERKYLEDARKSNKFGVLVAIIDGDLAGVAKIMPKSENFKESHIAKIEVMVQRKYEGQGIGKTLTDNLVNLATNTGFEIIYAYSNDKNKKAVTMLTRLDFKIACSVPKAFKEPDGSYDNELILVKVAK
ncbi:MAG: GNAT family N-acetyltransferase [Clostridia bacterium]|nr:GNAT family N-acetyltransferase [Clostridia bacterium]